MLKNTVTILCLGGKYFHAVSRSCSSCPPPRSRSFVIKLARELLVPTCLITVFILSVKCSQLCLCSPSRALADYTKLTPPPQRGQNMRQCIWATCNADRLPNKKKQEGHAVLEVNLKLCAMSILKRTLSLLP